jgi:hypothetical protein
MLQPIQIALTGIAPPRAPAAAETAAAVPGTAAEGAARNDVPHDRGREAAARAEEVRRLAGDPARPVGPPPAFEANVLDAERARLRQGALPPAGDPSQEGACGPADGGPGSARLELPR